MQKERLIKVVFFSAFLCGLFHLGTFEASAFEALKDLKIVNTQVEPPPPQSQGSKAGACPDPGYYLSPEMSALVDCDGMFLSASDFLVMCKAGTGGYKCTGPTAIGNCNDLASNRDLFLSPCYSNQIRLKRGPLTFCLVFYLAQGAIPTHLYYFGSWPFIQPIPVTFQLTPKKRSNDSQRRSNGQR